MLLQELLLLGQLLLLHLLLLLRVHVRVLVCHEVVLRPLRQVVFLIHLVHVHASIDVLVDVLLARIIVVASAGALIHVGPLGRQHLLLVVRHGRVVSGHGVLLLVERAHQGLLVLLLEGHRGGVGRWPVVEESDDFLLSEQDFDHALALLLIQEEVTAAGSVDLVAGDIRGRVNVFQGRQVELRPLAPGSVLFLLFLQLLLFLVHFVYGLLKIILELGLRLDLALVLQSCLLALPADVVHHFVELIDDSFVPHLLLFFCFGLLLGLVD